MAPGKATLTSAFGSPEGAAQDRPTESVGRGIPRLNLYAEAGETKPSTDAIARQAAATQTVRTLAPRFGASFDGVKVHTNEAGDARAKAHGAPAVADGKDIFLARDIDPASPHGQRVMAHEMAHVVQQTDAAPHHGAPAPANEAAFEREAHQVGDAVVAGGTARPSLRTGRALPQGYGSPEHQSMGDDVHSVLDPVVSEANDPIKGVCRIPELGGLSRGDLVEQQVHEDHGKGASHAPGIGNGRVADADPNARVGVPHLAQMLAHDPFVKERQRSLTISLRNFKLKNDPAGPYLAIDSDPVTKEVARYDVPVSPGDMTALNGDLYGSVENMRKAPVSELITLQQLLDREARWEAAVAAGKSDPKNEPNFNQLYDEATSWRSKPVYAAGKDLGPQASATGGDTSSYIDLALHNQAHFGEETHAKDTLEVQVHAGNLGALAAGPHGNFADGNEQAWMNGHARALLLAREAFAMQGAHDGIPKTPEQIRATMNPYGHEANIPATGLVNPAAGKAALDPIPLGADGKPLARSSGAVSHDSKLNDAYVESAGADHYLTDAFASGHQVVRNVVGNVTDKFVTEKGGRDAFLSFVVSHIQQGAIADKAQAAGDLGDFQSASRTWKDKAARGDSWLNSKWNPGRLVGIGGDGLKQKLAQQIDDIKLHAIGAKVVHDYYNRNGVIVHNKKGMTFLIKGDGHADEAPVARRVIAMAVLESRNQITETAKAGATANPMDVWDYTPDIDKTQFTETSGLKVMDLMFADSTYLWELIKDNFSVAAKPAGDHERAASASDPTQQAIGKGPPSGAGAGSRAQADVGQVPIRAWFDRRQAFVQDQVGKPQAKPEQGVNPVTVDGVTLPSQGG